MASSIVILFLLVLSPFATGFEFLTATIADIHEALLNGDLTCEEVIDGYLDRIDEYDVLFNGVININENAFNEGKALMEQYPDLDESTLVTKPLFCIPTLVKDLIDVDGLPSTLGVTQLAENYPLGDARVVRKIKEAGGIIIAKANTNEFAAVSRYSSSAGGTPRSPWDLDQFPTGSSCGNGIGGAAAYAPIGIGTDTFVSVVGPSSKNGLFGLRPATKDIDTVSDENLVGVYPGQLLQDVVGPVARDFDDLKKLANVMGYEWNDETESTIKVGLLDVYFDQTAADAMPGFQFVWNPDWEMVSDAKVILEALNGIDGIVTSTVVTPVEVLIESMPAFGTILPVANNCTKMNHEDYFEGRDPNNPIQTLQDLIDSGVYETLSVDDPAGTRDEVLARVDNEMTPADCESARNEFLAARATMTGVYNTLFTDSNIDVLLTPTLATANVSMSVPLGENNMDSSVSISVISGWPALNIPVGFTEASEEAPEGLPIGVLITAPPDQLGKIMEVARVFKEANNVPNVYPSLAPELTSDAASCSKGAVWSLLLAVGGLFLGLF